MSMIPIALQLEQMEESEVRLLKELGLGTASQTTAQLARVRDRQDHSGTAYEHEINEFDEKGGCPGSHRKYERNEFDERRVSRWRGFVMKQIIMPHGVSGFFSTSMALSKRLSTSLEDGSEAGQPVTQPVRPTRRCSTESSAGILISQRWPFSSVRSKKELMLSVSHCSAREASANRRPSRFHWRNNRSSAAHPARTVHGQLQSLAYQALAVTEQITKVLADRQK